MGIGCAPPQKSKGIAGKPESVHSCKALRFKPVEIVSWMKTIGRPQVSPRRAAGVSKSLLPSLGIKFRRERTQNPNRLGQEGRLARGTLAPPQFRIPTASR